MVKIYIKSTIRLISPNTFWIFNKALLIRNKRSIYHLFEKEYYDKTSTFIHFSKLLKYKKNFITNVCFLRKHMFPSKRTNEINI